MTSSTDPLADEAKAIVVLAFRNGPIEDVHAGFPCPACSGESRYSRISDSEMKRIMKAAVNRVYTLLRFKTENPDDFQRLMRFGLLCSESWDDPEDLTFWDF